MAKLKRFFAATTIVVTVLSLSVVAPMKTQAATAGDLIKMDGLSSVYFLGSDGKRYVFPNEKTYFSWYSDFSKVVTISQSELEVLPLGANVTVRPGTKLVKITTNPKVYAVIKGGKLQAIPDEATAKALYGDNWAKMIIDVPDGFFTNYTIDSATVSATAYPAGSLVKFGSGADVYYIDTGGVARKIANEASFLANRFQWGDVITSTLTLPATGSDITGAESALVDTSSGAGGTPAVGGTGLTVALASDTPASGTLITNTSGNSQAMAPFIKINFTAANDGDVMVTTLKLKRTGVSTDSSVDNIYLYDGDSLANRLATGGSFSSGVVTFSNSSGLFTVAKGTTKAVYVRADLNYLNSNSKTIGFSVNAASDIVAGVATVSGSFPVSGNVMSVSNTSDLGSLAFAGVYTTTPSAANTPINANTSEQEFWNVTLQGSNQDLAVQYLKFTAVGSIQKDDLKNFKLYASGNKIAEIAAMNDSNEVIFDLSASPLTITKGSSKILSLRGEIAKGSTRTFYFSFQNQGDVIAKDLGYNVMIEPYSAGTWTVIAPTSPFNWLISAGSLSISRSTTAPSGNIMRDGNNVVVGEWDFVASGEDMKVKDLTSTVAVTATQGNSGLDNGKIYVKADGQSDYTQIGNTKDLTSAGVTTWGFGNNFIVAAGKTTKVRVLADIKTSTSTSYSDGSTLQASIATGASDVQRVNSLGYQGAITAVNGTASTLTVSAAGMDVAKFSGLGNQTVVAGTSGATLAGFAIGAGTAEGVNISSLTVVLNSAEYGSITNLYIKDTSGTQYGSTVSSPSTSNIFSVNISLAANASKVFMLYGDIKSSANAGTWIAGVTANGSGQTTGNAVSGGVDNNMQTITIGNGSLSMANGSQPSSDIVLAGEQARKVAQFTFHANNEGFTVSELILKIENDFATNTNDVYFKYTEKGGTTQVESVKKMFASASGYAYSTATFTGLTFYVPKNSDGNLDVYIDTASLSNSGRSGSVGKVYLDYDNGFKATGDSGTSVLTYGSGDLSGNNFYIRKSKPTFAKQTLGTTAPSGELYKFSVTADASGGNIQIKQLTFNISTSSATFSTFRLKENSTSEITTNAPASVDSSGNVTIIIGGAASDSTLIVGATTRTFSLTYDSIAVTGSSHSATTYLKQDAGVTTDAAAATVMAANNITWSDTWVASGSHSTTTSNWTNGYLIKDVTGSQSNNW